MSLAQSVPRLLGSLVGVARTRLELLVVDLEAAVLGVSVALVGAVTAAALLLIGSLFASALLVIWLWDSHRLLSIALVSGVYLSSGLLIGWLTLRALDRSRGWFSDSLAEIEKDRSRMGPQSPGSVP